MIRNPSRTGESRDLLPRDNAIYDGSYGIQGLRAELDRQAGGRVAERLRMSHGAWPRLLSLFRLVYAGSQHEALPVTRYGGSRRGCDLARSSFLNSEQCLRRVANCRFSLSETGSRRRAHGDAGGGRLTG